MIMQLLRAEAVAKTLAVSTPKVYELARTIFPAGVVVRIGRRIRFNQEALEHWIESGGAGLSKDDTL